MRIKYFIIGLIYARACESLFQDYLGKNEYIHRVTNGWISASITVPLALLILIACALWMSRDEGNHGLPGIQTKGS